MESFELQETLKQWITDKKKVVNLKELWANKLIEKFKFLEEKGIAFSPNQFYIAITSIYDSCTFRNIIYIWYPKNISESDINESNFQTIEFEVNSSAKGYKKVKGTDKEFLFEIYENLIGPHLDFWTLDKPKNN